MTNQEKNMTDKEIINALEYCTTDGYCITCPYNKCTDKEINELAFDLINRQQAEIEKLEIELDAMRGAANSYKFHYNKAKSEAIKEFAEAVKMKFYEEFDELIPSIMADSIDKLVKEMVGE